VRALCGSRLQPRPRKDVATAPGAVNAVETSAS
jgi:hypothetical protein